MVTNRYILTTILICVRGVIENIIIHTFYYSVTGEITPQTNPAIKSYLTVRKSSENFQMIPEKKDINF
jgi:hypothetical protein